MTRLTSIFWTVLLVVAQLVVVGEAVAPHVTPLAREFRGWSIYAAMLSPLCMVFLILVSSYLWRSHRRLVISGLCVVGGAFILFFLPWYYA